MLLYQTIGFATTAEGTYCLRQFFIPTSGFLQFSLQGCCLATLSLYRGIGRLLFSIVLPSGIRPTVSTTEAGTYCLRQFFIPTSGFLQFSLLSTLGVLALRSPQQQVNPCLQLISLLVDYYPVPVLVCCCPCLDTFLLLEIILQFY